MNLINELNSGQIKLLENIDIVVENKEYTNVECKQILHRIIDYVMSLSKNEFNDKLTSFKSVLDVLVKNNDMHWFFYLFCSSIPILI